MPGQRQNFLNECIPYEHIVYTCRDTDALDGDYSVRLADGSEVDFHNNGYWDEVECKQSGVPASIIPAAIKTYLNANHPNVIVVKIDKGARKYEVKLQNGVEMDFDKSGKFLRYDD